MRLPELNESARRESDYRSQWRVYDDEVHNEIAETRLEPFEELSERNRGVVDRAQSLVGVGDNEAASRLVTIKSRLGEVATMGHGNIVADVAIEGDNDDRKRARFRFFDAIDVYTHGKYFSSVGEARSYLEQSVGPVADDGTRLLAEENTWAVGDRDHEHTAELSQTDMPCQNDELLEQLTSGAHVLINGGLDGRKKTLSPRYWRGEVPLFPAPVKSFRMALTMGAIKKHIKNMEESMDLLEESAANPSLNPELAVLLGGQDLQSIE